MIAATPSVGRRALVVSATPGRPIDSAEVARAERLARSAYHAFAPLLERWGRLRDVSRPESRLDYALRQADRDGLEPLHLTFLPLQHAYLTARAPNVAFVAWQYPDLPAAGLGRNPRNNLVRIAGRLDLILAGSSFTRDSLLRAGLRTPIHVVPPPVPSEYFALPPFALGQRQTLHCPARVLPRTSVPLQEPDPWAPLEVRRLGARARAAHLYRGRVKPFLPGPLHRGLARGARAAIAAVTARGAVSRSYPAPVLLDLQGVVYAATVDPFDPDCAWRDLLSAFLLALGEHDDATLVVDVVAQPELLSAAFAEMVACYEQLGLDHRCTLALVSLEAGVSPLDLAAACTYVISPSRAAALDETFRQLLAAGRPGIAPVHTSLADSFGADAGFVVEAHPEPTCWPNDPGRRATTRRHRLVWQSLHDQLLASYRAATDARRYDRLASGARGRMQAHASPDSVWPLLAMALDAAAGAPRPAAE